MCLNINIGRNLPSLDKGDNNWEKPEHKTRAWNCLHWINVPIVMYRRYPQHYKIYERKKLNIKYNQI